MDEVAKFWDKIGDTYPSLFDLSLAAHPGVVQPCSGARGSPRSLHGRGQNLLLLRHNRFGLLHTLLDISGRLLHARALTTGPF